MRKVLWRPGFRNVVCAVALLVAPFIVSPEAHAEEMQSGWYVSGNVTGEFTTNSDFESTLGENVRKGESSFDPGFGFSGAFGHGWKNIRVEGEISWSRIEMDSVEYDHIVSQGVPLPGPFIDLINDSARVDGTGSSLALMANGWYDLDTRHEFSPVCRRWFGGDECRF